MLCIKYWHWVTEVFVHHSQEICNHLYIMFGRAIILSRHILWCSPHQCSPWSLQSCLQRRGILLPGQKRKVINQQCFSALHFDLICVELPSIHLQADLSYSNYSWLCLTETFWLGTHCVTALSLLSGMGRHVDKRWSGDRDWELTRMWVRWSGRSEHKGVWAHLKYRRDGGGIHGVEGGLCGWKVEQVSDVGNQGGDDSECMTGQ